MSERILSAASVITMDDSGARAFAVAVRDGRIVAVGSLEDCRAALPDAEVVDLGGRVLMPGFVEPHSHLVMSGISTQSPAVYIAPWICPTWDSIVALARKLDAEYPPEQGIAMFGLDQLIHGVPMPTKEQMDGIFGRRFATIANLSGHGASVTTAVLESLGWIDNPPADPPGGHYLRDAEGRLTGVAMEPAAYNPMIAPILPRMGAHPLHQAAQWYAYMARSGITSASDHMYTESLHPAFEALAMVPGVPLRVTLYQASTEGAANGPFTSKADPALLDKRGVKIWVDGSPWMGNIACSYPYLDSEATRRAGITDLHPGMRAANWTREQLDAFIDENAPAGWQMSCHVNGDLALDMTLDAFEAGLQRHGLAGTDHRWRVEHLGGARADQFARMKELGVWSTLGMFQMMLWGDLLDGEMFDPAIGSQWTRAGDCVRAGCALTFHNDGNVSRPWPLANVMGAVTRRSFSGRQHGPEQAVGLDDALRAVTINSARLLRRDGEVGSIEVGKLADFVELSADPYGADLETLTDDVAVEGTWVGGERVDLDRFLAVVASVDPTMHAPSGS